MQLFNAVQRLRKFLGLSHSYVDQQNGGSGSVTTIPASPEASRGTVRLRDINEHEVYRKYDPVPYNRYDVPYGGIRVSRLLNEICTKTGLQATVQADPSDWKTIYHFKNVSKDKLVRVRWMSDKQNHEVLLEPDEATTIKVDCTLDGGGYPEIKAFQYGQRD